MSSLFPNAETNTNGEIIEDGWGRIGFARDVIIKYYLYEEIFKKSKERDSFAYENSNLRARKDDLTSIVNKLLKAADVQTSVDDLVGSDSLQNTIAKQIKEKLEQARGHGEVLDLYKQKTQEMERTLKELEELKKEIGGTKAEKEEAKRKIQEQEEKLKKQETSLKAKESENEEYNNIAEQMLRMQIEIERLKKENELLKEDRDDFKDVTLDIKQDTDELNTQNEQGSHEDL